MTLHSHRAGSARRALIFAMLLVTGWQAPALARDPQTIATDAPAVQQIEVDLADLDLASVGGKVSRDYRIGETAAAVCDGGNSDQSEHQIRTCVQRAVADARTSCTRGGQACRISVARHAKPTPRHRPNYGARSFP